MKLPLIYVTLLSACQAAAYISRMSTNLNRLRAPASVFRPGVSLSQRPWTQRVVPASNRPPYVVYRNGPNSQRYPIKQFGPTRMFPSTSWKSTRLSSSNPEIDFVRAASQTTPLHANGAIHTIPAPNLSLSEKPIVVIDADAMTTANGVMSDAALIRHNAALQLASELGLQAVALHGHSLPQTSLQPHPFLQHYQQQPLQQQQFQQQQFQQQQLVQHQHQPQAQQSLIPQQFSVQGFTGLPSQQDLIPAGTEGIVIPPSALYQPDPNFLQKLQSQLLQRFPSVEFIPYNTPTQVPVQTDVQTDLQQQSPQPQASQNEQVVYINKDSVPKQTPSAFATNNIEPPKNVVQRETQESTLVTLVPQGFVVTNITDAPIEISTAPKAQAPQPQQQIQIQPQMRPQNVTVRIVPPDSHPITTTIKYVVETTTEAEKSTPVYYPPTQDTVVQTIPSAFTTGVNELRAAAVVTEASEKPLEKTTEQTEKLIATTIDPDMYNYFSIQNATSNNDTVTELKPILGIPFAKKADSASVAYTFVRTDEKEPRISQNGERIFMGQLVEAKITEDNDYNMEKASILSNRAPLRLFVPQSSTQSNTAAPTTVTVTTQKAPVVKARIPPRSKLTFDDKTGEPVLRIYASYVENTTQKESQTTRPFNIRSRNAIAATKQDNSVNWKAASLKSVDRSHSRDQSRVTSFGLKLRSRSDDYVPLFDEYEE